MPGKIVISELDYKEAASLINLETVEKNHNLLDSCINEIEDSELICKNPEVELFKIRSEIFYLEPDFLKNPNEEKLKGLKKDITLYKNRYECLAKTINEFIDKASKSLELFLKPSNNLKKEIIQMMNQFEENVKNLCVPLISEQQGLKTINVNLLTENQKDEFNEEKLDILYKIDGFKEESKNLNKLYNTLFKNIHKSIQELCDTIKEIPSSITYIQNQIEKEMSNYEETLEIFTELENMDKFHELLIKIKESFGLINKETEKTMNQIQEKIENLNFNLEKRKDSFYSLKEKSKNTIENLKNKSNSIKDDIIAVRDKYKQKEVELPEIYISNLIINIVKPMEESIECIKQVNLSISQGIEEIQGIICDAVRQTSLDLLFIMDITGSMEGYLEIAKQKLIGIMNIIKNECIGIDINLGFIGYKDVTEILKKKYLDKDFTKDHKDVEDCIKGLEANGGADTAEHVSWAFSRAIKKSWSSKTKFAILVADAPCHGKKYHDKNLLDDYPEGVPNEENIEMLVDKMGEMNISLICMELNKSTDLMYNIFKDIYKNKENCLFDIIPIDNPELLTKIVSQNTIKAYRKQQFQKVL